MDRVKTHSIETDVLVIGGGIAGCFAALKAVEEGSRVIIVSKATTGQSGCTLRAASTYFAFDPHIDDLDEWVKEAVEISDGLDDPVIERNVIAMSYELRQKMERWGVEWRVENGRLVRTLGLGMKVMRYAYFYGGPQMMWIIRSQLVRNDIQILDRIMIVDLLVSDNSYPTKGRVVGAVGFDIRKGDFYCFQAKSVVLAAGDWGVKSGYHPSDCTGDGQAAALRAGAELRNIEQMSYGIGPAVALSQPGLAPLVGHGAILINRHGERYMEKYNPVLKEIAPRPQITQGTALEIKEGRGPIFMDLSHLPESELNRLEVLLPQLFKMLRRAGYDFRKVKVEYVPVNTGNSSSGGVRLNERSETNVPGLYVAGGNSDRMYAGSPGLTGASVTGYIAGKNAARDALNNVMPNTDYEMARTFQDNIYSSLKSDSNYNLNKIMGEIRDIIDNKIGLLKHNDRLINALNELEHYENVIMPELTANNYHNLKNLYELKNIIQIAKIIAQASLLRTETRYYNYREDYPVKDDQNWRKWIIARMEPGGQVRYRAEDINNKPQEMRSKTQ
ncbi:MAG: FAD-binding protein [Chloroflexi bacterium]|nr:FAD-binding protein [Chloroflexota bacterium]